jgi:hypothetical protein
MDSCWSTELLAFPVLATSNSSALVGLWQSVDESVKLVQYFLPIIALREGTSSHSASLAYQVIVDPSSIATEVVITHLKVHALIIPLLSNNINLIKQEVI